jgi:hypothetical protein
MKRILSALFVAALACSMPAMAQTASAVTGASKIGTMTVHTAIVNDPGIQTRVKGKGATGDIIVEVTIFLTGNNQVSFAASSSTIHFTDGTVNDLSTSQVYDLIGVASVATANSLGYIHCSNGTDVAATVTAESCVSRTGYGSSTKFTPLNYDNYSSRQYNDVCGTATTIDLLNTVDPGCSGTIR